MSVLAVLAVLVAAQVSPADEQERLHAFADDLAAETGVPVAYVARGRAQHALPHFRIGSLGGPTVVIVPARLTGDDPIRDAFAGDVEAVCAEIAGDDFLGQALAEAAVLVPLDLGKEVDEARYRTLGDGVDPDHNFPVRWSSARAVDPLRAGPYPGALPRVARLSDWLLDRAKCAAVVLAGAGDAAPSAGMPTFAAGSAAAFCAERVGAQVVLCDRTAAGRADALRAAIAALPRLELRNTRWQRLGPTSWSLDVEVFNSGTSSTASRVHARARRPRGITLSTSLRSRGVTWMTSSVSLGEREPHHVVSRGIDGLALPDLPAGGVVRVRLFFSGEAGAGSEPPVVDVEARAPRSLRAVATRLAP